jgi:predicted RNA-binding Zn-ribbon protein involved in translation (DUF1610 family)
MPQPHEREALTVTRHLLCPNCLNPMRIRTAQVTADGREKIQFVCGSCKAEAASDEGTDLFLCTVCD